MAADCIEVRHQAKCRTRRGGKRCNCHPTYRARLWRGKGFGFKDFSTKDRTEAESWLVEARRAHRAGTLREPPKTTVAEAAASWLAAAEAGAARTRSGARFKPSTLRGYDRALKLRVLPSLGHKRLADVRRADVQAIVDELLATDVSASTIRNTLDPLRSIYRHAIVRDQVTVNPTTNLEVPTNVGRRVRVESLDAAERFLAALPGWDRALWTTAFRAGLRRGELRGLRWEDVDFDAGLIRVERGWDDDEGGIDPKSEHGRRTVPLDADLRRELVAHKLRSESTEPTALVFGVTATQPFHPTGRGFRKRVKDASTAAKVELLTLHVARHCCASYMIDAGLNPKALSTYMGHSSIKVTYDLYGHLMPGNEAEAAGMLDAYYAKKKASAS